jgi:hypothetical protein
MWFENSTNRYLVDDGLLYPLRQTALRKNVQIQLSKLEKLLERHSEFLVVIHNGTNKAYYVPYSWLNRKVLRRVRVRRRPYRPSQRYVTVDELRNQNDWFSFGLDRDGKPLRFSLRKFLNVINSRSKMSSLLAHCRGADRETFPEFLPGEGPFILSRKEAENRYDVNWPALKRGKRPRLLRGLEGRGFRWKIERGNALVITHPKDKVNDAAIVNNYARLLESGRISTAHVRSEAQSRPYQHVLREACLNIYSYHCAMCDVDVRSSLTASHIKPASIDRRNRTNLRNVILLCQLHDSLFDHHLITVKHNYTIACSPKLQSSSKLVQEWVFDIEGKMISLPSKYPPSPSFLAWHAGKCGAKTA